MNTQTMVCSLFPLVLAALVFFAAKYSIQRSELRKMRRFWLEETKQKEALEAELGAIDFLLHIPALDSQKTRFDKISYSLATNRRAAQGGAVSNKKEDYAATGPNV